MNCAWKELLSILPLRLRSEVDTYGKERGLEIRLRLDKSPQLIRKGDSIWLKGNTNQDELNYVVNMACRYSPWTAASASNGYLTAAGGHRIGLCGEVVMRENKMSGFKSIHSLNIRIARDFPGIAKSLSGQRGSILIIGRPGCGKTTLLRDLIRQLSFQETIGVVDERGELFPTGFDRGAQMDVISGCGKPEGIACLLRTMAPDTIAIDEITAQADTAGLMRAAWCGVRLLATAHASCLQDLKSRVVYRPILESKLFQTVIVMQPDKSYGIERMTI